MQHVEMVGELNKGWGELEKGWGELEKGWGVNKKGDNPPPLTALAKTLSCKANRLKYAV